MQQVFETSKTNRIHVGFGKILIGVALLAAPASMFAQITAHGGGGFVNQAFIDQSSQATITFDATPTGTNNSEVGLSDDAPAAVAGLSTTVRFGPSGLIDVINGAAFTAAAPFAYHTGVTYHIREDVDVVNHVYSVAVGVGLPGGPMTVLATNAAFRATANANFNLDDISALVNTAAGTMTATNLVVTALAAPVANPNCSVLIPPNPLTAAGLATPYLLSATNPDDGPCIQGNANNSAFVQAAIINTDTGVISLYAPLIITAGSIPATPPVVPVLPLHNVVAIWFGFNGNNLTQTAASPATLTNNNCVNGFGGTLFTQFSYCNAVNFFAAADAAIAAGKLVVPAPGISPMDGMTCPEVRSYPVVDQDQSDNVPSSYLITPTGQVAQNTAANRAGLFGAVAFGNPSDNRLVDVLLDPALGCVSFKGADLADANTPAPGLALNELVSRQFPPAPLAQIPPNDPMAELNVNGGAVVGNFSLGKVNAYRVGVNQTPLAAGSDLLDLATIYCADYRTLNATKLALDRPYFVVRPSPFPNMANSLFTFMAMRANASYTLLGCADMLGLPDRVALVVNGAGIVIDATIAP